ncbi:serine/threonine protein kinase [Microbacterium oxydans]|uniref:serine/threonine-protein kinase n=1 Tax=Microbacterium sp. B19(2022) TaxID=2914045 RepID=UPI0014304183|nr:serine/threonine-protein kinase [Microbacterium sp. B19(2022)]NJI60404.1 serine/threonine protein kinase [Microbacterium sp. B19(2022)]
MTDDSLPTEALLDGRYRLQECVGQGGMARVYRADDIFLGRTVAIKMLRDEMDGAQPSGRARSEMTVLASLNHPGLVTLYDAQLVLGRAEYLVMEFIDGPTLSARIAQGPLAPAEVARLAADLAEALHVVHGAGIVHRDIKPSNVLVSRTPLPGNRSGAKLADFGISVLVDGARLTTPGLVIGTAAYLAPEQLRGEPPAPPADIYSLGLVLLEALTGTRAFPEAEGIGAAMARLIEMPEVPASLGVGWTTLLTRMLAADPADRPRALEVFAASSELVTAATASSRPAPPAPPRPAVPATVAAMAAARASSSPATTPTLLLPAGPVRPRGLTERKAGGRRRRIIGGAVVAAVAASVLTGVWLSGIGAVDPDVTDTVDTEQSPAPTAEPSTTPVNAPDQPAEPVVPVVPAEDTEPGGGKPTDEQKAAEKAAKDAEKAQQKADEDARKEADKAQKEAEKSREG